MLDQAVDWILGGVRDSLNIVWKLLASTLFHLPDVTGLPAVQELTSRSLMVVNASYVLAIVVTGLAVMTQSSLQLRHGAGELLPRLVIGIAAANFATHVCIAMITGANALVMALTGEGIASRAVLGRLASLITSELADPVAGLLVAAIGLILLALLGLLMAGWITRFVALVVLCGIAPLALACHGTPWTEGIARLWWRSIGGVCLTVILQAVALNTSLSIFLAPGPGLSGYGLPTDNSGLLSLFIVAVLLWITVRIPSLVRRHVSQGSGGRANIAGALVRLVIARQVTRGLGQTLHRAGRGVAAPARGAHRVERARHATGPARRPARRSDDLLRAFTGSPAGSRPRARTAAARTPGASASPVPTASRSRWQGPAGPGMRPGRWPAHPTGTGWPGSPAATPRARRPPSARPRQSSDGGSGGPPPRG